MKSEGLLVSTGLFLDMSRRKAFRGVRGRRRDSVGSSSGVSAGQSRPLAPSYGFYGPSFGVNLKKRGFQIRKVGRIESEIKKKKQGLYHNPSSVFRGVSEHICP